MKITKSEIVSFFVLAIVFVLFITSQGLNKHENQSQDKAKDIAYDIAEAAKLAHMDMEDNETVTFTENSYFDGNDANHGPFILTIDRYENTIMDMWVDNTYCVRKQIDGTEFVIDENVTSENGCLNKTIDVNELLYNYDLIEDSDSTGADYYNSFASKNYYAGIDPSNYVVFSNSCFRILNITTNNYLKLVYEGEVNEDNTCSVSKASGYVDEKPWDESGSNNWNRPATLNTLFKVWHTDDNVNNVIKSLNSKKLVVPIWYIGSLSNTDSTSLVDIISSERSAISESYYNLGLLSISDYIKASSNTNCQNLKFNEQTTCSQDNYLIKDYESWLFDTVDSNKNSAFTLDKDGVVALKSTKKEFKIRPVIYLSNNVTLTGSGRSTSPYIVK